MNDDDPNDPNNPLPLEAPTPEPAPAAPPAPPEPAPPRLANPFNPGEEVVPAVATEPTTFEQAKKLWLGGEHGRARALFEHLDLTGEQRAELPTLPGWNDQ